MAVASTSGKASAGFGSTETKIAGPCGLSISFPIPNFQLLLPRLLLNLPFPFNFNFNFKLSCDLKHPIAISAGVEYGGGRVSNHDPSPDLNWDTP